MNFLLTVIAAVVVAISVGAVVHTLDNYSGLAYVLFLILDLGAFSFFCRKRRVVLVRPFIFFVGVNLAVAIYFLSHGIS